MSKKLPAPDQTLYLLDISSFIFRAFFAIRALSNSKGEPTNAIFGVAHMLQRLIDEAKPHYLAVAYDSKEPSFRDELFSEYKANRSSPPEDLIPQFEKIDRLVELLGMHGFRKHGVEADDIIASMAKEWTKKSSTHRVVIVTGDKDLMQLVNDRVVIWDTMKEKIYETPDVIEKFGVRPDQIRDYLTLVGDSSDNIPGAQGIGPKTAAQLLGQYQTLDGVMQAARDGKISGKKGETLKESKQKLDLSQQLVSLKDDVQVAKSESEFEFDFEMTPQLAEFLGELEFHSILKNWSQNGMGRKTGNAPSTDSTVVPATVAEASPLPSALTAPDVQFKMIHTREAFDEVIQALKQHRHFAFDLETTSLNPRQAEIVGIALCWDPQFAVYIPLTHKATLLSQKKIEQLPSDWVIDQLRPLLADPCYKKIGQNLKYDWSVLHALGIEMDGIGADTMVAGYVLDVSGRHNLEALCLKYLGYQTLNYEEICGKGKDQIPFDEVDPEVATRYSAEDAWCAYRLWQEMQPRLEKDHLIEIFSRVDMPLVQILGALECEGVTIDVPYLKKLSHRFEGELAKLEQQVHAFSKNPVNLNSPKQLAVLLFDELKLPTQSKTKTGFSTDASVLEALAPLHEVPRLLLEHREIAKLKGTYVDPIPLLIDPKTHKLHSSFHQAVTATGRLSSSDPNLQNIPIKSERGKWIRQAFLASQGNVLISADYSQIELRILAHMSNDKELCGSFLRGEDVHRRTASEIFGIAPESVDDRSRQIAKAINFGLMYGKTPFGLAQELGIPRGEAKEIIDRYFERYSGVKKLLDHLIADAKEKGWVMTELGRKRTLPDIASKNAAMRNNAERMAMNTPIQGTAADMMKLAMIAIDEALSREKLAAKMIIQVHDEIVLDCPEKEEKPVLKLVQDCMNNAVKLKVPLEVNLASGPTWADL